MSCLPQALRRATDRVLAPFRRHAGRFASDSEGIAAVEFAMILPLMMLIYMGVLELSQGYQASRKTALVARSIADVVSQASATISSTDMANFRKTANWIMAPFNISPGQLRVTISSVLFTSSTTPSKAMVDWSVSYEGSTLRRLCGAALTQVASTVTPALNNMPSGLVSAGSTIIVADIAYDYKPLLAGGNFQSFGGGAISAITLKQTAFMRPRNLTRVAIDATLQADATNVNYCNAAF